MSSSKYFYNESSNNKEIVTSPYEKYNHSILRKESNILFGIDLNESNKENINNNFVFNDSEINNSNKNLKTPSKKIILFNKDNNTSGNYIFNSNNNNNINTNNNIIITTNNNNNLFTLSNGNEQNEKNNIKTELFNSSISKKFEFSEVKNKNIIHINNNNKNTNEDLNNNNNNENDDNNNNNDNNSLEIISYTEANNIKEEEDKKNTFNSFTLLNTNENNNNYNNSYITYRTKIDTEYNIEDLNFDEKNKSKSCLIYNNNNKNKFNINTHIYNKYTNNLMTIEEEKLKKIPHSKNNYFQSNFENLISNKIKNNNNNKFNFHSKTKSILNQNKNDSLIFHSDFSTSNNLWKFNNNNKNNIINENNNDDLYNWLKKINLEEHYKTFVEKGIFSMNNVINDIKNKKFKINKNDIEEIGISNPGHIYRILIEIEIEIGLINNKIISIIFNENSMLNKDEFYIKNDFFEYVFGCCGINNNVNYNKFNIDFWLKKIGLMNLKENFIFNGFDKIEYLILQMFSSCPVNDEILQKDLGIENEKDRDIIIMRLNKDVKYILRRLNNKNNNIENTPNSNNINNISNNINNIISNIDNNVINNTSNIKSTTENEILSKNINNNINDNNYCIIF